MDVVEAGYRLDCDDAEWLASLAAAAAPIGVAGVGVIVGLYDPVPGSFQLRQHVCSSGNQDAVDAWQEVDQAASGDPASARVLHRTTICETTSEALKRFGQPPEILDPMFHRFHALGVRDALNFQGTDEEGRAVCVMALLPEVHTPAPKTRRVWQRVAAHLGTALRLRSALRPAAAPLDDAAAVFDNGRCVHADRDLHPRLEALRDAAVRVDRARSAATRDDSEQALELWQGLFAGAYSLIDRFDTDGRRFLVARRNEPVIAEDRALTRRERQAVVLTARCHRQDVAAYMLGISPSTFRTHLTRAMRKLQIGSAAELIEVANRLAGTDELERAARLPTRHR